LNSGPSAIACDVVNANPKKNTDAASLERRDMAISPSLQWRIFSTGGERLAFLTRLPSILAVCGV
jgi:hypothetical protein